MRYGKSNGWLDGQAAAITREVGKGRITYIGAWLDEATMARATEWMLKDSGVQPVELQVPEGVEFSIRNNAERTVWIFVNLSSGPQTIALPAEMTDVLAGSKTRSVSLDRFGVAVLSLDRATP
jgi:beta-galactosidase